MEKIHVYVIYFPTSNKSYIGQTYNLERRMKGHLRSGSLVCRALYKYNDWQVTVLHTVKTQDEANRIEIEEIRNFKSLSPNGYNLTRGGEGSSGYKHTEEAKRKTSKGLQGNKNGSGKRSKEFCENCSKNNPMKNLEIVAKVVKTLSGKSLEELGHKSNCICCMCKAKRGETVGEKNPMFGRKRPDVADRNRNLSTIEQYKRLKTKIAKLKSE